MDRPYTAPDPIMVQRGNQPPFELTTDRANILWKAALDRVNKWNENISRKGVSSRYFYR
jgi:hypothetical protein